MTTSTCSAIDWYFQGHGNNLVDSAVETLGQPTPPLMAIMAEPDTISVLPGPDTSFPSLPPPWAPALEFDSWTCSTDALPSSCAPPRWPMLLPLGTARGAVLLLNVEQVSPLAVTGHNSDVTAVLRAWVMHLLLTPGRVIAATTTATTQLATVGSQRFITAPTADQLRQQLHTRRITPDVVILDDPDPQAPELFPSTSCVITTTLANHGWAFQVDGHTASLANEHRHLAVPVDAVTSIDDPAWHSIVDTLRSQAPAYAAATKKSAPTPTGNGAHPAEQELVAEIPKQERIADTPAPEPGTSDPPPHIWVRVMGEPTITPPDGRTIDNPGRTRVWTSVITYLATAARDGATREELRDCWPASTTVSDESIRQTLSRIRTFLGNGPDGQPLLSELVRGGRRGDSEPPQKVVLNPIVLSDWERWQQLVGDRPHDVSDDALAQALAHVRAPAFDVPTNVAERFEWSKFLKDQMTDAIPDAALVLATRHSERGNQPAATTAALAGLKANPQRQDLWRLALTSTPDALQRSTLIDQLRQTVPAAEIEPATRKLLN
jgi:hypothetical protein